MYVACLKCGLQMDTHADGQTDGVTLIHKPVYVNVKTKEMHSLKQIILINAFSWPHCLAKAPV